MSAGFFQSVYSLARSFFRGRRGQAPEIIDVERLEAETTRGEKVIILDVRSSGERSEGFIPGSVHIPIQELPRRLSEIDTEAVVITSCLSGHRSAVAAAFLLQNGYKNVLDFSGGWMDWKAAGKPIAQKGK